MFASLGFLTVFILPFAPVSVFCMHSPLCSSQRLFLGSIATGRMSSDTVVSVFEILLDAGNEPVFKGALLAVSYLIVHDDPLLNS